MKDNQDSKFIKQNITTELKDSYLDYAMSVIVQRALPDVRDGLKPVHRRILWDMWDSGLTHQAKFRKSANVIGQVLGRYHPHGDVAVYDALVRMAQDFSLRYPLVEGQGNFGSIDGDPPAAYRYTEARLAKISTEMLVDIEKETVDWRPNYDGSRKEPSVLPAKLPNLLLFGSVGIAVGMATNIPPHNIEEIIDALLHLADNPEAETKDLLDFVKGPDFPTGGLIFNKKAIAEAYMTGRGPITMRGRAEIVERKAKGFDIVVTEIPYLVNKSELVVKIAQLVTDKKIEGIRDLRDESDKEGLRIVVELKNEAAPQKILNQLYTHTDLQKDFHLNMIALADGLQPRLFSLKEILEAYLVYRQTVVRRRTMFDLKKAEERAHILEGLAKALDNIDKVIALIKKSKDREDAYQNLRTTFKFSDPQTNAILDMRLHTLAQLEHKKIDEELKEKLALIKELNLILKSPKRILQIIKDELEEIKKKHGNGRRTQVVPTALTSFQEEDLIPEEQAVITLSSGGYIKRLPPDTFRAQKRGGKGLIGSDVAEEDFLTHFLSASTHDSILFFTDRGRVFQTKVYEIPAASRTAKGRAIQNFLELPGDEKVEAILAYATDGKGKKESPQYLTMITQNGLIKRTTLEDFKNIRRTGIIAISLQKGDKLKWVKGSSGKDELLLVTKKGQSVRFKEDQARPMGRTAAGVRAIKLKAGDEVVGFDIVPAAAKELAANAQFFVVMERGYAKRTPLKEYRLQNRGGSGIKTANITPKTGALVSGQIVTDETEILAISIKGQVIRTDLGSVRVTSRSTQGVRIMDIKDSDRLAGVVIM
ncbi:MAG: DNA gyrase subunit A [Anaplasmataceae bacterium]|nr:DNA gyrase subunit A [Anaplasmataceae bacterium]